MKRFIPAAFGIAGAVALGLCAGNQARLISDSESARSAQSAAAALPFVFFASSSAACLALSAASITDRWEA